MTLYLKVVLLLALHLLEALDVSPHFVFVMATSGVNISPGVLFDLTAGLLPECFFLLLNSLSLCALSCYLEVALAGAKDVGRALLGLVKLLPSLGNSKFKCGSW